jgi:predicted TIM-barrel fold metal-dependent hydrolase
MRVNANDPDLKAVIKLASANLGFAALRCDTMLKVDVQLFADGGYSEIFAMAAELDLPVFVLAVDNAPLIERYLRAFPSVPIVVDHCGFMAKVEDFEAVLRLADHPNAYLKWGHPRMIFGRGSWPYPHLREPLRRAIHAFGAERIMWSSDITAVTTGETWGESLFSLRDSGSGLSAEEQSWILGRTARTVLRWPATEAIDPYAEERAGAEMRFRNGPIPTPVWPSTQQAADDVRDSRSEGALASS